MPDREFITPPALEPGDSVAVIGPSSGGAHDAPHVFELGLQRLRKVFDLEPVVYPTARQSNEFLADSPRARAADLHAALRDPDIDGIIVTIGGADQLRILRYVDPEVLRNNPKRFYGMSDNTNLNLLAWTAGVVSYNGAQLMNELGIPGELPDYTERYCRRAFFDDSMGEMETSDEWTDEPTTWWTNPDEMDTPPAYEANPGWRWAGDTEAVEGRLWGGNQSIIEWQLAVNRYLPDPDALDGTVLCMETSETVPDPDMVGGMLICLGERGLLERFDGVLVGRPPTRSHRRERPPEERDAYREQLYETIIEEIDRYNPEVPIVLGLDWGHTTPIAPLPIGGQVEIDPSAETVRFE